MEGKKLQETIRRHLKELFNPPFNPGRRDALRCLGVAMLMGVLSLNSCSPSPEPPAYLQMHIESFPTEDDLKNMNKKQLYVVLQEYLLKEKEFEELEKALSNNAENQLTSFLALNISPTILIIARWLKTHRETYLPSSKEKGDGTEVFLSLLENSLYNSQYEPDTYKKLQELLPLFLTREAVFNPSINSNNMVVDLHYTALFYSLLQTMCYHTLSKIKPDSYYPSLRNLSAIASIIWASMALNVIPSDTEENELLRQEILTMAALAYDFYSPINIQSNEFGDLITTENWDAKQKELLKQASEIKTVDEWKKFLDTEVKPLIVGLYSWGIEDPETKELVEKIVNEFIEYCKKDAAEGYVRLPFPSYSINFGQGKNPPSLILTRDRNSQVDLSECYYITFWQSSFFSLSDNSSNDSITFALDLTDLGANLGDLINTSPAVEQATQISFPWIERPLFVKNPNGELFIAVLVRNVTKKDEKKNFYNSALITLPLEGTIYGEKTTSRYQRIFFNSPSEGSLPDGWREIVFVDKNRSLVIGRITEIGETTVGDLTPPQATAKILTDALGGLNLEGTDRHLQGTIFTLPDLYHFQRATVTESQNPLFLAEFNGFGRASLQQVGVLPQGNSIPVYMFGGVKEEGILSFIPGNQEVPGKTYVVIGKIGENKYLVTPVEGLTIERTTPVPALVVANAFFPALSVALVRGMPVTGKNIKLVELDPLEGVDREVKGYILATLYDLKEKIRRGTSYNWFSADGDEPVVVRLTPQEIASLRESLQKLRELTQSDKISIPVSPQLGSYTFRGPRKLTNDVIRTLRDPDNYLTWHKRLFPWLLLTFALSKFTQVGGSVQEDYHPRNPLLNPTSSPNECQVIFVGH